MFVLAWVQEHITCIQHTKCNTFNDGDGVGVRAVLTLMCIVLLLKYNLNARLVLVTEYFIPFFYSSKLLIPPLLILITVHILYSCNEEL